MVSFESVFLPRNVVAHDKTTNPSTAWEFTLSDSPSNTAPDLPGRKSRPIAAVTAVDEGLGQRVDHWKQRRSPPVDWRHPPVETYLTTTTITATDTTTTTTTTTTAAAAADLQFLAHPSCDVHLDISFIS